MMPTYRPLLAVLLAGTACLPLVAGENPDAKRPIRPEDITALRWVTAPALSPDGKQVAYLVVEWDQPERGKATRASRVWLAPTDGSSLPRALLPDHARVRRPQWSPDGRSLAFLSAGKVKNGKKQIYLMPPDGASTASVTDHAEDIQAFQWSPDGTALAFTALAAAPEPRPEDAPLEVGTNHRNTRLWIADVSDRKTSPVTQGDQHVLDFAWAPDGKHFAATVAPTPNLDDVFQQATLVVLDRETGRSLRTLSRDVNPSPIPGSNLAWSPDGKTIAFTGFTPQRIARRLAVMPAGGGQPRYPLRDDRGTLSEKVQWCTDSRHLWVHSFETTRNRLLRVDTVDGSHERVGESVRNFWNFAASRDERTLVLTAETGQMPPNVLVLSPGQRPRLLTDLNPQLAELRLGDVQELTWQSKRDGHVLYGVLVTPPGRQPGRPAPTIVELHGGPQGMWWTGWLGTYLSRGQYLASHGYVVFLPNPRGSIGQGEAFVEANRRDWGGGDYQDVIDGIDALIEQKIADPNRLALGGSSYGGYLTAWATTQTERFRAAVVDAGITDLATWNLTNDISGPLRHYMGGDEIRERPFYDRHSPLTYIRHCRTPTLVLHGDKDERVPLAQGRAWYRGLKLLGIPTEMVVYPGEGHGLNERANHLDVMRRVLAWYDRHLRGEGRGKDPMR